MINLLGRRYKLTGNAGEGNLGDVWHTDREINLNGRMEMHIDQAVDTLVHECVHVISTAQNLDLDENQTRLMTTGIMSLLRDNGIPVTVFERMIRKMWRDK